MNLLMENAPDRLTFEQTRGRLETMFPYENFSRKEARVLSDAFDEIFEAMQTVYVKGATEDDLLPLIEKYQGA